MKFALLFIAFTILPNFAFAEASDLAKTRAEAAAQAIMKINFDGETIVTKVVKSSGSPDDLETVVVEAYAADKSKQPLSALFTYTIELVTGSVWSVKTSCETCG